MEDIKENLQTKKCLKVNPFTTQQEIMENLNDQLQKDEIKFSIKRCHNGNELLAQIINIISFKSNITSLNFKLQNYLNLDLEKVLSFLNTLPQLLRLTIDFCENITFSNLQKQTIGYYLKSLKSLNYLEMRLNCKGMDLYSNCLLMEDAYEELIHLRTLKVQIQKQKVQSNLLNTIFGGVRTLTQLEEFSLEILCDFRANLLIEIMQNEIKYLKNIKNLSISILWKTIISKELIIRLIQNISCMNSLEKLKMEIPFRGEFDSSHGVEYFSNEFCKLINLKELNFIIPYSQCESILPFVRIISFIPHLERTQIDLYIQSYEISDDELDQLSLLLSKIPNLSDVKIHYCYFKNLSIKYLINLIAALKNQNQLQTLEFIFERELAYVDDEKIQIEDFYSVIRNLSKIKFNIQKSHTADVRDLTVLLQGLQESTKLQELSIDITSNSFDQMHQIGLKEIISNKTNLTSLNIYINKQYSIAQKDIQECMQQIGYNTQLKVFLFEIKSCKIYDQLSCIALGKSLLKLKNLEKLHLYFGKRAALDDKGFQFLSNGIMTLSQLKILQINFSLDSLSFESIMKFIERLQQLTQLKNLNLKMHGGNLDNKGISELSSKIKFPQNLQTFSMVFNSQEACFANLQGLFEKISILKCLEYLQLKFKKLRLNYSESVKLTDIFSNLKLIRIIEINFKYLDYPQISTLFKIMPFLLIIKILNLDLASNFMPILFRKKVLNQEVYLNNCYLANQQDINLMQSFSNNLPITHLRSEKFHQGQEMLSNQINQVFCSFQYLVNLKTLELDMRFKNQINTQCILQLGQSLLKLVNLQKLHLQLKIELNQINWEEASSLSESLSNLAQLKDFRIQITNQYSWIFPAIEEEEAYFCQFLQLVCQNLKNLKNLKILRIETSNKFNHDMIMKDWSDLIISLKNQLICLGLKVSLITHNMSLGEIELEFYKKILLLEDLIQLELPQGIGKKKINFTFKLKKLVKLIYIPYF